MNNNSSENERTPVDAAPVAQQRVTSEELTQALAQIEARKEVEARHAAGTIPLGQAVEELGLEATPEEIFAEVQAQRHGVGQPLRKTVSPPVSIPLPSTQKAAPVSETPALTHCPACSRKLLTQASALCNWCGARINNPQYQEQAAFSRQSQDQQEREQVETVALEEARYGIYGRLKRRAKQNPGSRNPLG